MSLHVGLDLGGTNVKCAVVDDGLNVLATDSCPTAAERGEDAVLERVAALGRATVTPFGGAATAGLALPGHFDAADGTGLDFYLAGSAPLIGQGDGSAGRLGGIVGDPTAIANWSVDLRTAAGRARTDATFVGVRN